MIGRSAGALWVAMRRAWPRWRLARLAQRIQDATREGSGRLACRLCAQLLRYAPEDLPALALCVRTYGLFDQHALALAHARRWTELDPASSLAWYYAGTSFAHVGDAGAAWDCYERAFDCGLAPGRQCPAFYDAALAAGRGAAFIFRLRQWLVDDPASMPLGETLARALHDHASAREMEELVAGLPELARGQEAMLEVVAFAKLQRGQPTQAEPLYARLTRCQPGRAQYWVNLAQARHAMGRADGIDDCWQKAWECEPGSPAIGWLWSLYLLAKGDLEHGWPLYENRLRIDGTAGMPTRGSLEATAWRGQHIVLLAEQGVGDQIMFASCLPDVLRQAPSSVTLECHPKLHRLMEISFPDVQVVASGVTRSGPMSDVVLAAGSLLGIFRRDWAQIKAAVDRPFLRAEPSAVTRWRRLLDDTLGSQCRIGLAWRGGTPSTGQERRTASLLDFLPLATPHTQLVCLQHDATQSEIADFNRHAGGHRLWHWPEVGADMHEMAALISCLDAVITVQCSVVHLAGGLGRPGWVLLPELPEWRYVMGGADRMAWYPSLELLRMPAGGRYADLVQQLLQRRSYRDHVGAPRLSVAG